MGVRTRVLADIEWEMSGKTLGHLRVPHSHDDSAWGAVAVPVAVFRNGEGPTLLLTGGVHGDEYEGPIILSDLLRSLSPEEIRGRVIVIPALHLPAARAGTRTSPIDGKDINRTFPGNADGTFAFILSHYVAEVLLPMVDVVVDLHSGGRSLECMPCTMSHILDDAEATQKTVDLARAFGAPFHIMSREVDGSGTFQSTCERKGVLAMSSELGGGNRVSLDGLAVTERGVRNVLCHLGLTDGRPATRTPTRIMILPDAESYHFAPCRGIFRPFLPLGSAVESGQPAGAIYDIEDPMKPPIVMEFRRSGILWTVRGQGRIEAGDAAAVVIREWNGD